MHKLNNRFVPVLSAGLLTLAGVAEATTRTLPAPLPSGFADSESSRNVPLSGWKTNTQNFVVALAASVSPTSSVQVAFGNDANHDEDLEPEETSFVLGNDCLAWFMRDECTGTNATVATASAGRAEYAFRADFVPEMATWNLAKVTIRGTSQASDLSAQVKYTRNGTLIVIR